jgi:hypothetical protein
MNYEIASEILNRHIFDGDKITLLRNIAERPERFTGLFRPTKPKAKILQNLLQSHEIRFGDAMEELIKAIIRDLGFTNLSPRTQGVDGEDLSIDQYFTNESRYYFVEQKVRDDHDSTKKRGQIDNFEKKLDTLQKLHGNNLIGVMHFIDPDLVKNRNFYLQKLSEYSGFYNVELHLFYGAELFTFLGQPNLWDDLIDWLQQWKEALPELPEINFDSNPEASFQEIKELENRTWRKLIANDVLWDQAIMSALFKEGTTLILLLEHFQRENAPPYPQLASALSLRLQKYYFCK